MSPPLGPEALHTTCPTCQKSIKTNIEYKSSTRTHLLALLLCCLFCWPCAASLYCTGCARNVEHRCPSCNTYLGEYKR